MGATQSVGAQVSNSPEYFAYQVLQCEYSRLKAASQQSFASSATDEQSNHTIDRPEVTVLVEVGAVDDAFSEDEVDQEHFVQIYHQAIAERDVDLLLCRCPSVIIYKYLGLSEIDKAQFLQSIVEAATSREKKGTASKKKKQLDQDYSKSFGGTAEDTKVSR